MAFTNTRIIHTGLYGDRAFDICDAVRGQMSDGLWEGSRGYDKYWTNFRVKRMPNNEVVFEVNTAYATFWNCHYVENPFANMSDSKFLEWIAYKIKTVIKSEADDNAWPKGWWKRDNCSDKSIYLYRKLDVTVADIYAVYDSLLGRKRRSTDTERIFGKPLSEEEITVKLELEAQKLKIEKMKQEAIAKAKAEYDAAKAEYDAKIAEINAKYVIA